MALLFIDGCENNVSPSKWTTITGTVNFGSTDGVLTNTGAISFPPAAFGTNQLFKRVKQTRVSDRTDNGNIITRTSFWFKCTETITTEAIFMQWREYYYPDTAVVAIGTDGKLKISNWYPVSNTGKRVYYTTTMARIDDNQWHHIELVQYYIGTAAGLIEVYVDNLLALKRTGTNLAAAPMNPPALMGDFIIGGLINGTLYIDDLIIWDEQLLPDTFIGRKGPTNIYTIRPSADTSWANSTPSSGSDRYSLINENLTNFSNLVNAGINTTDLYEFDNVPVVGLQGDVYAISTSIIYSADRTGFTSNLRMVITKDELSFSKGNTFTSYTSNIANGDTYTSTFVANPWNVVDLNTYKIGFEVLS